MQNKKCKNDRNQRSLTTLLTIKIKKIMAATNWTAIYRGTQDGKLVFTEYQSKLTYKTALAIAKESTRHDLGFELVCVVETSKIMIKNDKKEKKKSDL